MTRALDLRSGAEVAETKARARITRDGKVEITFLSVIVSADDGAAVELTWQGSFEFDAAEFEEHSLDVAGEV